MFKNCTQNILVYANLIHLKIVRKYFCRLNSFTDFPWKNLEIISIEFHTRYKLYFASSDNFLTYNFVDKNEKPIQLKITVLTYLFTNDNFKNICIPV